jgi:hypothetical protein
VALDGTDLEPWIDDLHGIVCVAKMNHGAGDLPLAEMEQVHPDENRSVLIFSVIALSSSSFMAFSICVHLWLIQSTSRL